MFLKFYKYQDITVFVFTYLYPNSKMHFALNVIDTCCIPLYKYKQGTQIQKLFGLKAVGEFKVKLYRVRFQSWSWSLHKASSRPQVARFECWLQLICGIRLHSFWVIVKLFSWFKMGPFFSGSLCSVWKPHTCILIRKFTLQLRQAIEMQYLVGKD